MGCLEEDEEGTVADDDSDGADFLAWQRQHYVDEAPVSLGDVPEPTTIALAILCAACAFHAANIVRGRGSRRAGRHDMRRR